MTAQQEQGRAEPYITRSWCVQVCRLFTMDLWCGCGWQPHARLVGIRLRTLWQLFHENFAPNPYPGLVSRAQFGSHGAPCSPCSAAALTCSSTVQVALLCRCAGACVPSTATPIWHWCVCSSIARRSHALFFVTEKGTRIGGLFSRQSVVQGMYAWPHNS